MITNEEGQVIGRMFLYTILIVGLVGVAVMLWGEMRPTMLDQEREANTHSPQYVEARRTEIMTNVQECARINTQIAQAGNNTAVVSALQSQRAAIRSRVQRAAASISFDSRPIDTSPCN